MTPPDTRINTGRRLFLAAGSLTVSFTLLPAVRALAQSTEAATPGPAAGADKLPGNLSTEPMLDAWVRIDASGRITVNTGKAELGTGIRTAFIQIAAEQLQVAPAAIHLVTADTGLTPNEGYTAGSHSTADSGTAIMHASAQVRGLLLQAASQRLGVAADTLAIQNGEIRAPDGRTLTFGDAVAGADLHQKATMQSPLIDPKAHKVIGTSLPRVDIPGKVTGGVAYVQDMRLPGMMHARIVRPPSYGARLVKLDSGAVEAMPGVVKVVRDGSFLAVVARDEWQAIQAMRALYAATTWDEVAVLPSPDQVNATLLSLPRTEIPVADTHAPAAAPAQTLRARYTKPYLMHGSIGPSCAVAHLDQGKLTVWTHSQGVFPLRGGLAELLGMDAADIRCIHTEGSGCYGHNAADDAAADAALVARAMPGTPIRLQWMREQEHTWEPYNPAMITDVRASLDASGKIVDWQYELWSNSHNQRIENAGRFMSAVSLARPFTPAPPKPIPMPEGGGDRNSIPLYDLPNLKVQHHFLPDMPIRVSAMRGLGAYMNVFTIESFMDELAVAAQADPVEFRLRHLSNPRARAVVELAARNFGWTSRPQGTARSPGKGVGFAFAQYKNLMSYLAMAVEIDIDRDTGIVRIVRVSAAVDSGQVVNPDGVRNQIEGGIIQSFSWTLFEQVAHDTKRIRSYDWSTYPILRFSALPAKVDVQIIDRPGMPFLGAGEAAQGPAGAALNNAIADATGKRLRDLPLGGRIRSVIG